MGADIKSLRNRIKSVDSTLHLTKAMGLVASSKIRKAMERMKNGREYENAVRGAIEPLIQSQECKKSPYMRESRGENEKLCLVVIAGDRGLAGGYNSNIFKLVEKLSVDKDAIWLPIGKKAVEYAKHRNYSILTDAFAEAADQSVASILSLGKVVTEGFANGEYSEVILVFTEFVSMVTQRPVYENLLPLQKAEPSKQIDFETDLDPEEMLNAIVPQYVGGVLYSALCESLASESGARRMAMNSANKNAEEIIGTLMLHYNRVRQAAITQEITEIVSGAEAL